MSYELAQTPVYIFINYLLILTYSNTNALYNDSDTTNLNRSLTEIQRRA